MSKYYNNNNNWMVSLSTTWMSHQVFWNLQNKSNQKEKLYREVILLG